MQSSANEPVGTRIRRCLASSSDAVMMAVSPYFFLLLRISASMSLSDFSERARPAPVPRVVLSAIFSSSGRYRQ
jgi:hypothetical protein